MIQVPGENLLFILCKLGRLLLAFGNGSTRDGNVKECFTILSNVTYKQLLLSDVAAA
jgi:hypothetical protein